MCSQSIEKGNIEIVEIALKFDNKLEIERILTYLVINNEVYTGVVLDGDFGNFTKNDIPDKYKKMIYNAIWIRWEDSKYRNKTKFNILKEKKLAGRKFYWRCFEICTKYIIIPMKIDKNDFFCFYYNKNKCVVGLEDTPFKKIKRLDNLPQVFVNGLKENKVCID